MKKSSKPTKLVLIGASGRLGSLIDECVKADQGAKIQISARIGHSNAASFSAAAKSAAAILDVSTPKATIGFLKKLKTDGNAIPYVIGCTGWTDAEFKSVQKHASFAPVLFAPNFSTSVTLLLEIIEQISPVLSRLGYEAVVNEIHHNQKKDTPSGTAKAILKKLGTKFTPQVHASRSGKIVGTHELQFIGPEDVLTLRHEALDRKLFARGALLAASWISRMKTPGLYSMKEVLSAR